MLSVGDRIRQRCFILQLSARALSQEIGVQEEKVYRWISNDEVPNDMEFQALGEHLNCAVGFLRYGMENPKFFLSNKEGSNSDTEFAPLHIR